MPTRRRSAPPAAGLPRTAAQRVPARGAGQAALQAGRGRRRRRRHGPVPRRLRSVDPAGACGRGIDYEQRQVDSREEAEQLVAHWRSQGYDRPVSGNGGGSAVLVDSASMGSWSRALILATPVRHDDAPGQTGRLPSDYDREKRKYETVPGSRLGRQAQARRDEYRDATVPPESERKKLERFRLFSAPTRHYLRRRAWRYFRRLGKDASRSDTSRRSPRRWSSTRTPTSTAGWP